MQKVIIMVGVPASGKSTESVKIGKILRAMGHPVTYISTDYIRDKLGTSNNKEIFEEAHRQFRQFLIDGFDVIFDSRCIYEKNRRYLLSLVPDDREIEKICVYMNAPFHTCLERNRKRGNGVSSHVIYDMKNKIQKPRCEEGFDKLYSIYTQ